MKKNNICISAFSLIELMVVIAIVAVLAAIAVPAYKSYIIGAKASRIVSVVDNLLQQSYQYANAHGNYGNAYTLGLSATPGSGTVDVGSFANLGSYFDSTKTFNIGDQSYPAPFACGKNGSLNGYLTPQSLGLDPAEWPYITVNCDYWNYNGINNSFCTYSIQDFQYSNPGGGHCMLGNIIPGWVNAHSDSSCSQDNYMAHYNSTSFQNSTCQ